MSDIWGFLLQTLTVSGVAVFLLIIKALFKDKLSPKWQFAVWGVLMITILFPAGLFGRYALINWQIPIDFFRTLSGDYGFSKNFFPLPYINSAPVTLADYIFVIYIAGVIISVLIYLVSHIRLRLFLRKNDSPAEETVEHIREIGKLHGIKPCKIIAIHGLSGAFICGVIRPVLVIPADREIDDKIILHELIHLKNKDTFLSIIICLLRCLHWCNPLVSYCADRAINDMESRCDQAVLELLEGEERREYGLVLLSMVNERFSKTPGSTCINNGGKNIGHRVEAIARFKKYPAGMSLVSICMIILLSLTIVIGTQAAVVNDAYGRTRISAAEARSVICTTPAGAIDTYAKSVIRDSALYRLMCAPESYQKEIVDGLVSLKTNIEPTWDSGLSGFVDSGEDYYIYNLQTSDNIYNGYLVLMLGTVPDDMEWEENNYYYAYQKIRAEKENGRWVVYPESKFDYTASQSKLSFGCSELPAITYTATAKDFKVDISFQTSYTVDNKVQRSNNDPFASMLGSSYSYTRIPKPNAEFDMCYNYQYGICTHLGTQEERKEITRIGISYKSVMPGEEKPDSLTPATGCQSYTSSSSDGTGSAASDTHEGWGPEIELLGSGSGGNFYDISDRMYPEYYAADLYINNELYAQMELYLKEEIK